MDACQPGEPVPPTLHKKKLSFLNRTYPGFRHYEEADDQVEECTAAVRKEHAPDSDTDI